MEIVSLLALGFAEATSYTNLLFCFLGVFLGTMIGVLPGLGPMATISMLLPLTYSIGTPSASIIFLAGIYYGSQYGGSTTAILLKIPGESSSIVTMIDGNKMAQNGRAGAALTIAALASFFAGSVATLLIAAVGIPLSEFALTFGPREYTALMITGMLAAVTISSESILKSLSMISLGVLLGLIGTDVNSGMIRFSFGILELSDGISFGIIAMGVFGLGEILWNFLHSRAPPPPARIKWKDLYPTKQELKSASGATLRGTVVGSLLGILPGAGVSISSFIAYAFEKKINKNPEKFGTGIVEGVAAPESANNAAAQTGFIPMLTLGLPTTPLMALIVASLIINNVQPGPQVIDTNPALFWGLIVSMWIGNAMLLVLNLPLIGLWVKILQIPTKILFLLVTIICVYGAYSINHNLFDIWMLLIFAVVGYVFKRLEVDPTPLALGFVIGPMLEEFLRRSLMLSRGDWSTFLQSSIAMTLFSILALAIVIKIYSTLKTHD